MLSTITIQENTTPDIWESYHTFVKQMMTQYPYLQLFTHPLLEKFKTISLKRLKRLNIILLMKDTQCVGVWQYTKGSEYAYFCILPTTINQGLTEFLKTWLTNALQGQKVRVTTSQQEACDVLKSIGGNWTMHDVVQTLQVKEVSMNALENLLENTQNKLKTKQLTHQFYTFLPEHFFSTYLTFYNKIVKDIPVLDPENGEKTMEQADLIKQYEGLKAEGGKVFYCLVLDKDNKIVGLNEVWLLSDKNLSFMLSGLTAVKATYRGQKIAQFAKVSLLKKLKTDYPNLEVIETVNSIVNKPILHLNKKLGFVPVSEEFIVEYQAAAKFHI